MFQILNSIGGRVAGDCAALSAVTAVLLPPTWSLAQGNHRRVPAGWGCISPRITAGRALSWLVDKHGHPQKVISPIHNANGALEMLLLFGLQKRPMGNITAAIQILEQVLSLCRVWGVGGIRHFEPVLIPTKQRHTNCKHAIKCCTACLDMVWQYLLAFFFESVWWLCFPCSFFLCLPCNWIVSALTHGWYWASKHFLDTFPPCIWWQTWNSYQNNTFSSPFAEYRTLIK